MTKWCTYFSMEPLYHSYEAIGIHTQSFGVNKGVRITYKVTDRIEKWIGAFLKN